jgi:hypothetical protein
MHCRPRSVTCYIMQACRLYAGVMYRTTRLRLANPLRGVELTESSTNEQHTLSLLMNSLARTLSLCRLYAGVIPTTNVTAREGEASRPATETTIGALWCSAT